MRIIDDEGLQRLGINNYGDRLAILAYVKDSEKQAPLNVVDRVKRKLCESKKHWSALAGNKNSKKKEKRVDIGWLHGETKHDMRQIRQKRGGGTRSITLDINTTVADLLDKAVPLFFPEGKSPLGNRDDFIFSIRKFDHTEVESSTTLEDLYQATGFRLLRLYLCSEPRQKETVTTSTPIKKVKLDPSPENLDNKSPQVISNTETADNEQQFFTENDGNDILANALLAAELSFLSNSDQDVLSFDDEVFLNPLDTTGEKSETLQSRLFEIKVHRGHVLEELIQFFVENDSTTELRGAAVHVTMILPNGTEEVGEDNGGVMRDMLTEFWQTFYDTMCDGNSIKIPTLSPRMDNKKWKAVGCILAIGYYCEKYWPIELSPTFLDVAMSGVEVKKEDLLQEYLRYLPDSESDLLSKALQNFEDVDKDDLLDFFDDHNHVSMPSVENIRALICDIAHKEMIQTPAYVAECWRDTLHVIQPMIKSTHDTQSFVPTFKNVWPKISFEADVNKTAQSMLKKYIKELDKTLMKKFLRFITGKINEVYDWLNEIHICIGVLR